MIYAVSIRRTAQKELEEISSPFREKIEERMLALGANPRPVSYKKFKGAENTWRIRIGDYRLLYEIDDSAKTVTVIKNWTPKHGLPLISFLSCVFYFGGETAEVQLDIYGVARGDLCGVA